MSKRSLFIILIALVCVSGSLFADAKDLEPIEVIAAVHFTLKDSSQTTEFEEVAKAFMQVWNDNVPGTHVKILKADRGNVKGHYIEVVCFDTKETRDSYWSEEGKRTEKLSKIYKKHPEIRENLKKVQGYISIKMYGDFIALK